MDEPMKDYPDRMTLEQARTFKDDVLNIVSQIPYGRVTTYGHIAALAGWPSHSRMVGRTLRYTSEAELMGQRGQSGACTDSAESRQKSAEGQFLPCHRVVNNVGRTAPGWSRQRPLLESEGITFKPNGHVDMQRHLWEPDVL
jgi:methylated-DNA-protein-cysteine methyltransferase-like protein